MDINLGICESVIDQIDDSISNVKGSYDCDWNDDVHDSFESYVKDSEAKLSEIKTAAEELLAVGDELTAVNIDELSESADSLFDAINSI